MNTVVITRYTFTISCVFVGAIAMYMLVTSGLRMEQIGYGYIRPWCTVAASVGLLIGAWAGLLRRTWGVLMMAVSATSFLGAWAVGIANMHFVGVAAAGFTPMLVVSPRLFGFDAKVSGAAIALALLIGTIAALAAGPGLVALRHINL